MLPILYRDGFLLAINKPSGLAVHRGAARDRIVALQSVRDLADRRVYPVHRLDRSTSGALLLAFDAGTARRLQEKLAAGEVEKRYLALVRGIPPEKGVIDHPIPRAPGGPRVPEFRRLAIFERYSLVEARPLTGRLHQIRRHFKHLSHPLIGDVRLRQGGAQPPLPRALRAVPPRPSRRGAGVRASRNRRAITHRRAGAGGPRGSAAGDGDGAVDRGRIGR